MEYIVLKMLLHSTDLSSFCSMKKVKGEDLWQHLWFCVVVAVFFFNLSSWCEFKMSTTIYQYIILASLSGEGLPL